MPTNSQQLHRRRPGPRAPRGGAGAAGTARRRTPVRWCASAPTMTFSSAVIVGEEPDVLERAGDAQLGDLRTASCRRAARPSNRISPLGRLVDAGHHVEAGGLAGAVRPDQAEDLALADGRSSTSSSAIDAAEPQGDVVDLEQRRPSAAVTPAGSADVATADRDCSVGVAARLRRRPPRSSAAASVALGELGRAAGSAAGPAAGRSSCSTSADAEEQAPGQSCEARGTAPAGRRRATAPSIDARRCCPTPPSTTAARNRIEDSSTGSLPG